MAVVHLEVALLFLLRTIHETREQIYEVENDQAKNTDSDEESKESLVSGLSFVMHGHLVSKNIPWAQVRRKLLYTHCLLSINNPAVNFLKIRNLNIN